MEKVKNTTDSYLIKIFNHFVKLAPVVGCLAGITFTIIKLLGYFEQTSMAATIAFDFACLGYIIAAVILKKTGIDKNGVVDSNKLLKMQMFLTVLILLQWNLISYIFPTRDFWGYAPLFVLLSAFFFDSRVVGINIIGLSISIAVSWSTKQWYLMPVRDGQFMENMVLRIIALVVSFGVIFIFTKFAEMFKEKTVEREHQLDVQNTELKLINMDIIQFAADMVEKRDDVSGEHVKRVRNYTKILAWQVMQDYPEYGLNPREVETIAIASMLHDIGKIGISDNILLKAGKLTPEEFEIIKSHTIIGAEVADELPERMHGNFRKYCKEICLSHHERDDGNGYPNGISGDEIPISAQLTAVADCFDALTKERPYKGPIDGREAVKMIINGECGVFSEKLMKSFRKCSEKFIYENDRYNLM